MVVEVPRWSNAKMEVREIIRFGVLAFLRKLILYILYVCICECAMLYVEVPAEARQGCRIWCNQGTGSCELSSVGVGTELDSSRTASCLSAELFTQPPSY